MADMMHDVQKRGGLHPQCLAKIEEAIKNAKISIRHLHHWRKARSLGPACNSPDSAFDCEGKMMTVADYFSLKSKTSYKTYIPGGKLKYPSLPAINLGSKSKPVYVPPELVVVPGGQSRSNVCTGDMTAQMIRYSFDSSHSPFSVH